MKAIIFDGVKEHIIPVESFFQYPIIESANKAKIISLYESSKVYELTIKWAADSYQLEINDETISFDSVVKGTELLHDMIIDMNGSLLGSVVIKFINNKISRIIKEETSK